MSSLLQAMQQYVDRLPQRLMNELHAAVRTSVHCAPSSGPAIGLARLQSYRFATSPAATHFFVRRGGVVATAGSSAHSPAQQVTPPDGTSSRDSVHISQGHSAATRAAARYASARHIVAQHHLRRQQSGLKDIKQGNTGMSTPQHAPNGQQQQQQQQPPQQRPAGRIRSGHMPGLREQQPAPPGVVLNLNQLPSGQQLQQQVPQPKHRHFADAVALYSMYAKHNSMVYWQKAALGLQQLVPRVSSPLQAQQVWQVAVALQAQPLMKQCARVLGGAVVGLVKVTLQNHDLSILQALIASRDVGQFSFNKRHVDHLLLAAVAADVGLEELQALLDLVPPSTLSNRSYFVLIKSFMARQQFTEAAHCFHQMEVAGLHVTPALEQLQRELRCFRAGQQVNTAPS